MPPPPLNTTPGDPAANAYVTRAEADEILLESRMHADIWAALDNEDKDRCILQATKILDQAFWWEGSPASEEQALRFPMYGLVDLDGRSVASDSIPVQIKQGCAEQAAHVSRKDRVATGDLAGLGFSEAKVGSIDVTVNEGSVQPLVSEYVTMIVSVFGRLTTFGDFGGASGGGTVTTLRA